MMSQSFGPRIPKALVEPWQKLPFGDFALWGPAEPVAMTQLYLASSYGAASDFMRICRGRKVHSQKGAEAEYDDEVPCKDLAEIWGLPFAQPWRNAFGEGANESDSELAREAFKILSAVAARRLP